MIKYLITILLLVTVVFISLSISNLHKEMQSIVDANLYYSKGLVPHINKNKPRISTNKKSKEIDYYGTLDSLLKEEVSFYEEFIVHYDEEYHNELKSKSKKNFHPVVSNVIQNKDSVTFDLEVIHPVYISEGFVFYNGIKSPLKYQDCLPAHYDSLQAIYQDPVTGQKIVRNYP